MSSRSHYEFNYEVELFSFVKTGKLINMDAYRDNYDLNWEEIISEYLNVGIGDLAHFASQYVFAKALINRRTSQREEMQTMYIDIITRINDMIKSGKLPKAI